MPRVLINSGSVDQNSITITQTTTLHHLRNVIRAQLGQRLECFDGTGRWYAGPIIRFSKSVLVVEIQERSVEQSERVRVILAQALIRPERFDWMVAKATELNVTEVIPLVTSHTVVRLNAEQVDKKLTRWQRIANEAAQQCGRTVVPHIAMLQRFAEFAPTLRQYSRVLVPTLAVRGRPLCNELRVDEGVTSIAAIIGPEGDFTDEEVHLAQRHGAVPVSLGRLTLRSETAALAVLAIVRHCSGGL